MRAPQQLSHVLLLLIYLFFVPIEAVLNLFIAIPSKFLHLLFRAEPIDLDESTNNVRNIQNLDRLDLTILWMQLPTTKVYNELKRRNYSKLLLNISYLFLIPCLIWSYNADTRDEIAGNISNCPHNKADCLIGITKWFYSVLIWWALIPYDFT